MTFKYDEAYRVCKHCGKLEFYFYDTKNNRNEGGPTKVDERLQMPKDYVIYCANCSTVNE